MPSTRAVIFVNGHLPDLEPARRLIHPGDTLIAADGGTRYILALGLLPSVVIGDLDSLTTDDKQRLEESGIEIRQYPRDKDDTDLALALHYAVEAGHREILVVAALGGRLDQSLGNLALLTDPSLAEIDVRLDDGVEEAFFVRGRCEASPRGASREVRGRAGDILSLLPWGGPAEGVKTEGLRWPLPGESLYPHRTRGISNEMLGESAIVSLESGLLLCIHRRQKAQS
ncbi:MAG: thiamine diphosphokinase [Anaerolineales bacterium]|nr:thiamine diphosphokinase [Anaerolineales bacterium]